jgi:hypothetical protein
VARPARVASVRDLVDGVHDQAGADERVDVVGEGVVAADEGHPQAASLDGVAVLAPVEVRAGHHEGAFRLVAGEPARRGDRVQYGDRDPAARLEHARQLADGAGHVVHVHQRHERDGQVGRLVLERERGRVGHVNHELGIGLAREADECG